MEEFLKKSFGESVTDEVMGAFKAELGRRFVPKADFNARRDELEKLRKELEAERTRAAEADRLSGELEELKTQYNRDVSDLNGKIERMAEEEKIGRIIRKNGGRNEKAVMALLDLENAGEEEISSQLKTLKKSDPYLFSSPPQTASRGNFPRSTLSGSTHLTYSQMLAEAEKQKF